MANTMLWWMQSYILYDVKADVFLQATKDIEMRVVVEFAASAVLNPYFQQPKSKDADQHEPFRRPPASA
ncbi:hypothetical protein [Mesorhizobium sp.]|jgi:hypothetical protein|uniref:hypothetical protein n=1 Tax=Mesorhizobium sp. TaxID=1871066 RepID=UPI0035640779